MTILTYTKLKYQNTDNAGLKVLFKASKASLALLGELAKSYAGGCDEGIFALIQEEKYATFLSPGIAGQNHSPNLRRLTSGNLSGGDLQVRPPYDLLGRLYRHCTQQPRHLVRGMSHRNEYTSCGN